jgi:hypothetical protein
MDEAVGEQLRLPPNVFTVEEGSAELYVDEGYVIAASRSNSIAGVVASSASVATSPF